MIKKRASERSGAGEGVNKGRVREKRTKGGQEKEGTMDKGRTSSQVKGQVAIKVKG
jgi:hypothetical protein